MAYFAMAQGHRQVSHRILVFSPDYNETAEIVAAILASVAPSAATVVVVRAARIKTIHRRPERVDTAKAVCVKWFWNYKSDKVL